MGLKIKRNDEGLYNIHETIGGSQLHDEEWITEEAVKVILIERLLWNFLESCLKIERTFPSTYQVNGLYEHVKEKGKDWYDEYDEILSADNGWEMMLEKFSEVSEKLKLDFTITEKK